MEFTNKKTGAVENKADAAIGLRAAAEILGRWGASNSEGEAVLRVSRSVFSKAKNRALAEIKLDRDQLARVSMVLNMHAALRTIFENPENVAGFMGMSNDNPYFNGRSPLSMISGGDFSTLYETFRRVDTLRGAQW